MKSLDTLVSDIYSLIDRGDFSIDEKSLATMIKRRLEENKGEGVLRMSNFGTPCERKLWYTVNLPEKAEKLRANVKLMFLIGDIIEEVILSLAEQAPGHTVEGRQERLELNGVVGHRDAIIDGVLVDVKSANSRSFSKFRDHKWDDDAFGYRDQLGLYAAASAKDERVRVRGEAAFLAVDKELGHIVVDKHKVDRTKDWEALIREKRGMLAEPQPPRRRYMPEPEGKSGNLKLGVACSYCPFKNECWKDSNQGKGLRTFLYSKGPVYLTHVAREPDVYEVKKTTPREAGQEVQVEAGSDGGPETWEER